MISNTHTGIPFRQHNFIRTRVHSMLEKALDYPLVTVVAGPGSGKTRAVVSFVTELDARVIWLYVNKLDNIGDKLWEDFITAARAELPQLAEKLNKTSYPRDMREFIIFLHTFLKEVEAGKKVLMVVDGYESLQSETALQFFEYLAEAEIANFCLMILSNVRLNMSPIVDLRNDNYMEIGAADLAFARPEIEQLFDFYGKPYTRNMVDELLAETDGWALAVDLLVKSVDSRHLNAKQHLSAVDMSVAFNLFEKEAFIQYDSPMQRLLIRLSLLEYFTTSVLKAIVDSDLDDALRQINSNMYISYDPSRKIFVMQSSYAKYLAELQVFLEEEERKDTFYRAGHGFFADKKYLEAFYAFSECGDFSGMLQTFKEYPGIRMSKEVIDSFQQRILLLPAEILQKDPEAKMMQASIYMANVQFEKAKDLFLQVVDDLVGTDNPERAVTLQDAYLYLADISLFQNTDEFYGYYKKASDLKVNQLLNGKVVFRAKDSLYIYSDSIFFLSSTEKGNLAYIEKLFFKSAPYVASVLHGLSYGLEYLFAGEAAYYTNDMQRAIEMAHQAVYRASWFEQHDIICNAYYLLARVSLYKGDYPTTTRYAQMLFDYIDNRNIKELYEFRDYVRNWYYFVSRDFDKLSGWITYDDSPSPDIPPLDHGRDFYARAVYLWVTGRPIQAIAFLDRLIDYAAFRGIWIVQLKSHILQAICYHNVKDEVAALDSLYKAYELSYNNNITVPFIELSVAMRSLIELAKRSDKYDFDPDWLEYIARKSSSHAKVLTSYVNEYKKHNAPPQDKQTVKLSKRETDVLKTLVQGMTRQEIADHYDISVNAVKKHITGIYNKLGAINRADAIYIATQMNLLH